MVFSPKHSQFIFKNFIFIPANAPFYLLKSLFICVMLLVWGVGSVRGQAVGDYGTSIINGTLTNWNLKSNWVVCTTPGSWVGATTANAVPNSAINVWIRSGSNYTMNANPGACNTLTITGTLSGTNNLNVYGNWTNNGTFTSGTGTVTFVGTSPQTIAGTAATTFYNLIINEGAPATTVTSTSKAFAANALTVTQGNLILQATDANYIVTGDLNVTTNGTLTHNVNWDVPTAYLLQIGGNIAIAGNFAYTNGRSHVQMTGSGKTINTGNSALCILTLASTGTITANGNVTVNNNFWAFFGFPGTFVTGTNTVTANAGLFNYGGTVNINGGTLNVTGGLTVGYLNAGTVTLSSGTLNADNITVGSGAVGTFTQSGGTTANISGNLTISSTGTYTCTNSPTINLGGNWTNNGGTFTPATSTVTFNGTNTTAINGTATTQTFNNIILNKSAGQDLNVSGSTTTLNVGGTFTETLGDFNAPSTMNVGSDITLTAGTFTAGTALTASGNWINNGGIFTAGTGTVTMNVTGKTIGGTSSTTFNNLTLGTGNTQAYSLGFGQTVNGLLNLQNNTKIMLGSYNLTLGASATCNGIGTNGCWIVDNGSGVLQKMVTANGSFTFPIGDGTYYSPLTLNFTQGTFTGAYVSVGVTNTAHPQNLNSINYFTRYWTVSQTGISSFLCNVTGTFGNAGELKGNLTDGGLTIQNPAEYVNGGWLPYTLPSNVSQIPSPYTFVANGVTAFGDFTVMGFPSITFGTVPTSTFTYVHGAGPSGVQQLYVYGKNLIGSFIVTPPADYEISLDNTNYYSTPLTVPQAPTGTVTNAPIYIRLKAGLAIGSYNENITCSTAGLVATLVPVTGTVTAAGYCTSQGQSNSSYYISGVTFNTLTNNSNNCSPNGYGDFTSLSTNVSVGTSYTLTVKVNTVSSGKVYAKAWIDWNNDGTFNNDATESYDLGFTTTSGVTNNPQIITVPVGASLGATRMRIASDYYNPVWGPCSGETGEVEDYTLNIIDPIAISTSSLSGFSYTSGSGPSGEQSFTVTGSGLNGDIIVTPAALSNFEISTVSGGIFSTSLITLHQTGGIVTKTTIYVRLIAGLSVGGYGPQNITLTSSGSPTKTVTCTGSVVPGITVGGGGSYCAGSTISLTDSTVTNQYWIGPNNYYSTLQSPTITNATTAMTGTYTVTGSTTTGPNLLANLNGNFELGYMDFKTSYTRSPQSPISSSGLVPEGNFDVIASPNSEHSGFCVCGDHTTGLGLQMVVNGAGTIQKIWESTSLIPVTPYTDYQFTYWVQTIDNSDPSPSITQLQVNSVNAGPKYTASTTQGLWTQFLYDWNSGSSTTADLILMSENTAPNGNDFALDDIVFQQVYKSTASVNVSVITGSSAPTVSIAASPAGSVSAGTSVTFTATPTNGGHPPTYQWKVNSAIPSTGVSTGSTYTYIPNNGDLVTCEMTSTSACQSGTNPYISNAITMTVVTATKNYWKGAVDSNWSNPLNWTSNTIPSSGDNVEFSTASTIPWGDASRDLTLDNADRVINNLTNLSSKNLIIPPARYLTVNGIITTNGNTNQIQIKADPSGSEQNGSLIFYNAQTSPVYGTVEMYSKAFCNSPSTKKDYKWQYFGIPVSTMSASPTFDGSYIRSWDETAIQANHWVSLNNASPLNPFIGYEITQLAAKTIVFTGQLVNWDSPVEKLSYTPITGSEIRFPGQNIYANPYTAAIDISKLLFGSTDNSIIENTVYLYSTGSWNEWTNVAGAKIINGSTPAFGQYTAIPINLAHAGLGLPSQVPSMQAMLIWAHQINSAATFKIPYSAVLKNTSLQRAPGIKTDSLSGDKIGTIVEVTGANYSDKMWLFSQPGCTRNFDNGWDGVKMLGNALAPQIFAIEPDNNYQVDAVEDINNTILGFQAGEDSEYTITFTHQNLKSKYEGIYLLDLVENKTVDITESGSAYTFVAESTPTTVKRFMIITRPYENDSTKANTQLKVFSSGNIVIIQNLGNLNGEMVIYDMMGRDLKKATFGPYGVSAVQVNTIPGTYVVNAATETERVSKRIILGN